MGVKPWWVVALSVACAATAGAATIVDGNILTDTVWTAAESPYVVEKETVTIKNESTLTIEPGVEARFEPGRVLTTDLGSTIVAVGAPGQEVVFTSNADTPSPGDWGKIELWASSGSTFEHCAFRYAETGLYVIACGPGVSYCSFEHCEKGIYCQLASPTVEHSSFTGSTWAAIHCYRRESVPVIDDCNLWDNTWNMYLQTYSGSEPEVTITAENNWWGSASESEIAASIHDKADNSAVNGVVDYDPWLDAQPVEVTSWGAIKALFRE